MSNSQVLAQGQSQVPTKNVYESLQSHFLMQDEECGDYIASERFRSDFATLLEHDRAIFDKPEGWNSREIGESPLLKDFAGVWASLKETYQRELPALTCSEIPQENDVAESFKMLLSQI